MSKTIDFGKKIQGILGVKVAYKFKVVINDKLRLKCTKYMLIK